MKIIIDELRRYIDLPQDISAIHALMEDVGLEVKRVDAKTVFNLELLANRGDHHSYQGVARELHGRTGWALHGLELTDIPVNPETPPIDIETDKCLNYALAEFKINSGADTLDVSDTQKEMISLSGNALDVSVVNVANFVGIEMGQPLMAFDADKIDGNIVVRESKAGERARIAHHENDIELLDGTIVVADQSKILAVAGVVICEEVRPTPETTRVYIESATFDPVKVRKAAKSLNIQSTSSARFERGADVSLPQIAMQRAACLLANVGWDNQGGLHIAKKFLYAPLSLPLDVNKINDYFETSYPAQEISQMLLRYGFGVSDGNAHELVVNVPSARMWDVKTAEDLYEEIAKGVGYNSLPSSMPAAVNGVLPSPALLRKKDVADMLVGQGFFEVFTDGFYSEQHRNNTGIREGHPLWSHVKIANAEDRSFAFLKNNTIAQASELVHTNLSVKNPNIKAFEWTRTFHPDEKAQNGLCEERLVLWAIAAGESRASSWGDEGKKVDVFYMKGLVEEVSHVLGIQLQVRQSVDNNDILPEGLCLHPTRRGAIYWNNKMVGVVGEVHPDAIEGWGISKNARPCFIEISQEILDIEPSAREYVPPSNLHPVMRDVCLLLPNGVAAGEIATYMKSASPWLSDVTMSDLFNSEATNNRNAVTFSLRYSQENAERSNFTADDINNETENVVSKVLAQYVAYKLERR